MDLNKRKMVEEFHTVFEIPISNIPSFPIKKIREMRLRILAEEFKELQDAEEADDLVEVCDALGDMMYVIYGTCVSYGIPIDEIFNEIHKSNMSKLDADGKPMHREDGKILKGPNFFRPNIKRIIDELGDNNDGQC